MKNRAQVLKVYRVKTDADVEQAATDLASDRFIGFSTWRWADLHAKNGNKPVYRYYYSHPRPPMTSEKDKARARGAVHSAEIEYAMDNLSSNNVFAWTEEDYKVSKIIHGYFVNFIKTGNPNGSGLPQWPATYTSKPAPVMHINVTSKAVPDQYAERYLEMEQVLKK